MAAPGKGSRWGSFLTQAVAGMEARLDNILADDVDAAKQPKPPSTVPTTVSPKPSPGPSRSGSTNRTNDRLQERLARAVAAKSAAGSPKPEPSPAASPRQSSDVPARASLESSDAHRGGASGVTSARSSQDVAKRPSLDTPQGQLSPKVQTADKTEGEDIQGGLSNGERASVDLAASTPSVTVTPAPETTVQASTATDTLNDVREARIKQLETELEEATLQHQEETHHYVEKLDALQSKLQYLSREATDAARKSIQSAPAGSAEKKLAEKDQQIAQLMEEGKNLGVTEQKHRTIMKKLRSKITEDEKEINDLKVSKAKLEAELETLRVRARQATDLERAQADLQKRSSQAQRETDSLRADAAAKDRIISELRSQLQAASDHAEAITARINDEALSKEQKRVRDLEEQVAALQVEKNLVADRGKLQAKDLMEKAERATERARAIEVEMKAEVQVMESKLEAMRMRAEETSSGAIGDSQAKLLRQVETLQTQYAIAGENWQGIEATLLARVSNLEKERDEALQRESDMRKKAREASLRAKRHEEELEDARNKLPTVQEDVDSYRSQLESLQKRAEEAESSLAEAKKDIEKQKASWAEEKQDRERSESADRRAWLDDIPGHPFKSNSRPESPLYQQPARTWSNDLLGLGPTSNKTRKTSGPASNDDLAERLIGRRPSANPSTRPPLQSNMSGHPTPPSVFSPTSETLPTPLSAHPMEQDDMLERFETSSSPQQVMQDMVSVSTVAAGPSVQLVERMSAAIRRLESEKVTAREELARMAKQRDEARSEIVALMRDSESGKAALRRVADLEAEVADVSARYETTLELLGEKSELVEELQADVQDVKAMYRDLVERTIK